MAKQLSWQELREIKRKDQDAVLEAWKKGELSDGSEYSDEEKQAMLENSIKIEWEPGHLKFDYDPWVEEMMADEK